MRETFVAGLALGLIYGVLDVPSQHTMILFGILEDFGCGAVSSNVKHASFDFLKPISRTISNSVLPYLISSPIRLDFVQLCQVHSLDTM